MSCHAFYELQRAHITQFDSDALRISNMLLKPIPRVTTTPAQQAAIAHDLIDIKRQDDPALPQIYRLQDKDGDDLLIYWAQRLRFPWHRKVNVPLEAQTAVQQFISVVEPNMPPSDKRHPIPKKPYPAKASKAKKKEMGDLRKRQWDEHNATNKEEYRNSGGWGVFHFGYWIATGQKGAVPASMSKDKVGGTNVRRDAVYQPFKDLTGLYQTVACLFQELRPSDYEAYRLRYNFVCQQPNCMMEVHAMTNRGCWHCLALLIKAQVNPHKDDNDHKNGWVGMTCLGEFTGGALVLPQLKRSLHFVPLLRSGSYEATTD